MATLTDREYDAELHKLHDQLLLMGAKVEEMIANSMRALTERDSELARRILVLIGEATSAEVRRGRAIGTWPTFGHGEDSM